MKQALCRAELVFARAGKHVPPSVDRTLSVKSELLHEYGISLAGQLGMSYRIQARLPPARRVRRRNFIPHAALSLRDRSAGFG